MILASVCFVGHSGKSVATVSGPHALAVPSNDWCVIHSDLKVDRTPKLCVVVVVL